jgi:thiamine-monophosphate kinase
MLKTMPRATRSRNASSKQHGELALIERIRQRAAGRGSSAVRLGIGDDCAVLQPRAGEELLVTTDFSLEGRHFRRDWHSPQSVGHRTLARGLSDLAAMGARPLAAFLSLALPRNVARDLGWLDGFLDGFLGLALGASAVLAGGDTSESPSEHVLADVVLLGAAPRGKSLRRSGAKPGDLLYCTGSLGGAAAELALLSKSPRRFRAETSAGDHPHLFPVPRLAQGEALLRRKLATACMDISDGLSTDLAHLCEASGVRAEVEAAKLPLHPLAQQLGRKHALEAALHGGEDYELLFTASATTKMPKSLAGVPITRIGCVKASRKDTPQVTLIDDSGARFTLAPQGWEHLR